MLLHTTIYITIFFSVLYFALIATFRYGWKKVFTYEPKGTDVIDIKVSVVVACKNEKDNIRSLITALAQQSYQDFELIIVNDHSTDSTKAYIKKAQLTFPKIQLIDAEGHGKKNALKEGILAATSDLIITTDADCIPSFHWVEAIASYQMKFPCDLLICPVAARDDETLFSRLQELELISLVGAAAGSAGAGMPILCNGASLAFKKSTWLESINDLHFEEKSGDDIFLLESVKMQKGKIQFVKSESVFVKTIPAKTVREFINQRSRWTAKSRLYTDKHIIFSACVIFGINLLMLGLLAMSLINMHFLILFGALFAFKYALDTYFLYLLHRFFLFEWIWAYALILSVLYPFYIVFVAISGLFFRTSKWK